MKKILKVILYLLIFFFLPSVFWLKNLLNVSILVLMITTTIMFLTQPDIDKNQIQSNKNSDRYSVLYILIFSGLGLFVEVLEWNLFRGEFYSNKFGIYFLIGITLIVTGTFYRVFSIRYLGRNFSSTVQIKKNQQLITSGPYSHIRHPSYLGAYVAMIGSAFITRSFGGLIIFGIIMLFVYRYRIKVEEKTLVNYFGEKYIKYQTSSFAFIPYIW